MKKIILFSSFLLIIPLLVLTDSYRQKRNYPNLPKDEKWEYTKERIFSKEQVLTVNGIPKIYKFSGPILYELYNATPKDSAAIRMIRDELKQLLPNKEIDFFKNYTGSFLGNPFEKNINDHKEINGYSIESLKKHTISFFFKEKSEFVIVNDAKLQGKEINIQHFSYSHSEKESKITSGVLYPKFQISLGNNATIEQRKRYLMPFLIRTIACSAHFYLDKEKNIDSKKSILNDKNIVPIDYEFSELDRFLLKKLYSPTFKEEFNTYLNKAYPWRIASIYFDSKKTKIIAVWVCCIAFVGMLLLGFSIFYAKKYKYSFLSYVVPILMLMICLFDIILLFDYFVKPKAFKGLELYVFFIILFFIIASVSSLCLMVFDKYIIKKSMKFTMQLVLKMGFTFFIFLVPIIIVFVAENKYNNWLTRINPFILLGFIFTLARGALLYLDHFSENLVKQKDIELSNLKALKSQAEVKLLQSQINPHFLYNSLNSIASLAQTDGAKTEKMALSLSDLFKYTINRKGKKSSTIGDEVEMVKNYLEVEQIRFGDRLEFCIHVDENMNELEIPMFLIQPLIENAIKHGVSKIEGKGKIQLNISKNDDVISIEVKDNGPLFLDELVSGHGLQTVYDLLQLSYGNNATLNMENTPEKAVTITINNNIEHA